MPGYFHYACMFTAVLLQSAVVALMLRRKLHREFTAFFCYTVFHVVRALSLFALLRFYMGGKSSYAVYFWSYWSADLVTTTLVLFVIYNVFQRLFRDYSALRRFSSVAFSAGVIVLLGISICVTAVAPGTEAHPLISGIILFERCLMVLQIGLILLLSVFARFAAIPWRGELSFGIVLGYGLEAAIAVAALSMRAQFGQIGNTVYDFMTVTSYVVAVIIWFLYILAPPQAIQVFDQPQSLADVREWNEALTELLSR